MLAFFRSSRKVPELKQLQNIKEGDFKIDGLLRFAIFIET